MFGGLSACAVKGGAFQREEICQSGPMRELWKRSYGRAAEAPPNERGGNSYPRPNATAPHPDSTNIVENSAAALHWIFVDLILKGSDAATSRRERSTPPPVGEILRVRRDPFVSRMRNAIQSRPNQSFAADRIKRH